VDATYNEDSGVPVPGREGKALQNFADAQTSFGKLAADDKCSEPEIFHHGVGGGMPIVKAESPEILHEILLTEEAWKIISTASFTSAGFWCEMYNTGENLMDSMMLFGSRNRARLPVEAGRSVEDVVWIRPVCLVRHSLTDAESP
jgi:hypothetical protein